jgi:hypothetical protein
MISAGLAGGVSTQWQRKAALIEPFLVAKVVLCWIVGLPVFALCLFAVTIWDKATLAVGALRRNRCRSRFRLKRANAARVFQTKPKLVVQQRCTRAAKPKLGLTFDTPGGSNLVVRF